MPPRIPRTLLASAFAVAALLPAAFGPAAAAPATAADAPSTAAASSGSGSLEGVAQPLEISGDLRPSQAAELSFKAGGQLASVKVRRGEPVKKGQLLASLSDAEARAQLAAADAGVDAAQAQLAMAEDAEKRITQLADTDAAPGMQKLDAKLKADAARAGLEAAKAQRALARANLDNHFLRAPFAGTVVRVPEGVGSTVGPGVPVMRLEKLDVLLLQAAISERDLERIRVGDEVVVARPNGHEVTGRVHSVVRSLDPGSRRAPVEVELPNADGTLVAGAYVRAHLRAPLASSQPR